VLTSTAESPPPTSLDHALQSRLRDLAHFNSVAECRESAAFRELGPEIERVLGGIEEYVSAERPPGSSTREIRAAAWNLERGIRLGGIIDACLREPLLGRADVLMLTEIDYGMARTSNRHVARELAEKLQLNYAFAPASRPTAMGITRRRSTGMP
jgi:hypothetical protein